MLTREQLGMTYINDTIRDVNGDGFKDFLVNWYPSAGCCLSDIYNVYLNLPYKNIFSDDYEFINPTFSPKEKIIRGIGYGHPGEVELYKYKWNNLEIDTVEFIHPYRDHEGKFIRSKQPHYPRTVKEGTVLNETPKEYHNIENYDWFTGDL
ncbi:MAG: hypothetical protein QM762_18445 [Chryseolinea sp.]